MILSAFCIIGYSILFFFMAQLLLWVVSFSRSSREVCIAAVFWQRRTGWCSFGCILLGWLPWIIAGFPGSLAWDSATQLEQFVGAEPLLSHHPLATTWMYGIAYQIGHALGWDSFGSLLLVLVQTLLCAAVYARIVVFCKELKLSGIAQGAVTAFFALVPAWGSYAQAIIKDTPFTGLFALFVLMTAKLLRFPSKYGQKPWYLLLYSLVALLACLMRNNGSYAIFPCLVLVGLLALRSNARRIALCSAAVIIVAFFGFNRCAKTVLKIPSDSSKEMLSIPLQQTARYLRDHPEDVEQRDLEDLWQVINPEILAECYDPVLSDPVKDHFDWNAPKEKKTQYLRGWYRMFWRHPDCYLQATQANSFGYYSIMNTGMYHIKEQYFAYIKASSAANAGFDVRYADELGTFRYTLYNWALTFDEIPVLGMLVNRGLCTWLMVLMALDTLLRRKKTWLLLFLSPALLLLTCIASPVNDLLRYYLPILASMPILLCMVLSAAETANPSDSSEKNPTIFSEESGKI